MGEHHLLEVYEPYEYEGPNPIRVCGSCVLKGPNGTNYYLLDVDTPVHTADADVAQILVTPRYNGDCISRAEESMCTVNICVVKAGVTLEAESGLQFDDIKHWGVGKITRSIKH